MSTHYSTRRFFLKTLGFGAAAATLDLAGRARRVSAGDTVEQRPNFILIFCDDLGYGDIGCFGSKMHRTPEIDRMASEGMRLTSFYVTSGVCTPSRSSLMTGCYPRRVNMHEDADGRWVLFPIGKKGLNPDEVTVAEVLRKAGYATACVGKWHLGDQLEFLPTRQGFDTYFGIPYSNDMGTRERIPARPPLPLLRNEQVIEAPVGQDTITKRYTEEAVNFITVNKDRPFFLYLPHTMPHLPIHAGDAFRGKSANGLYGDAVEEIDWSTGRILATLKELGIDENTLVVFTSDNGAARREQGGSNAPLSGWKGSTMEGGMRVPCVVRWPQGIPAGRTCAEIASTLDILPTFAALAGTKPPAGRQIDGHNIGPLLAGEAGAKSPHKAFYYYFMGQLQAVRAGKWKLHLPIEKTRTVGSRKIQARPVKLFDLDHDIGETTDVSEAHPEVIRRLTALADRARADLGDAGRPGAGQRPAGMVVTPKPLRLSRN